MAVANLGSAALPVEGDFQFQNNPRTRRVIFPGANQPRVGANGANGLGDLRGSAPIGTGMGWKSPPRG